jgi:hypothetical protein
MTEMEIDYLVTILAVNPGAAHVYIALKFKSKFNKTITETVLGKFKIKYAVEVETLRQNEYAGMLGIQKHALSPLSGLLHRVEALATIIKDGSEGRDAGEGRLTYNMNASLNAVKELNRMISPLPPTAQPMSMDQDVEVVLND